MGKAENTPELEPGKLDAGKEFNRELLKLGLDAELCTWVYDDVLRHHVLVIVTDFFDFKGPLAISRLLFKAYNASALPKEIDPFTVRLHSAKQDFGRLLIEAAQERVVSSPDPDVARYEFFIEFAEFGFNHEWVVQRRESMNKSAGELIRSWDRFERNVDRLAA